MEGLFDNYGMYLAGTTKISSKKDRTETDFPFHKLSNGALSKQHRGWWRRAVRNVYAKKSCNECSEAGVKCKHRGRVKYVMQGFTWKDKKQCAFLSNAHVCKTSADDTVKRYVKGRRQRMNLQSHKVVRKYTRRMGAVDQLDRSNNDWGISRRGVSNSYLRSGCVVCVGGGGLTTFLPIVLLVTGTLVLASRLVVAGQCNVEHVADCARQRSG
jgi:hypothetical protein